MSPSDPAPAASSTPSEPDGRVDGRRERRRRGRQAVVDAMIELIENGKAPPSADEVAARAGVSTATLFRYFPTLDELRAETIGRFVERHAARYEVPNLGNGSRAERIDALVGARIELYETVAPVARFARSRAPEQPALADTLTDRRAMLAEQVAVQFAPELEARPEPERSDLLAAVATLTSFESWELWSSSPANDVARGWRTALHALLPDGSGLP